MTAIALTIQTPTSVADTLGASEWAEAQFDVLRFAAGVAICADEEVEDDE